jgi:7,8-dihydroneopterin aldolase/epimerase/oxygenase
MIRIVLRELQVEAAVGVLDWELEQTQVLEVSCELELSTDLPAISDALADTLDYGELRDAIQSFCKNKRYNLLEALAEGLANHLFATFPPLQSLRLGLIKPTIFADAKGAGVELERVRCSVSGKSIQ